jgi:glutathione S-transferase
MKSFAAAPKGKLAYIVDGQEKIADSNFIVDYLKRSYGDPLDAKLAPAERAAGHAMKRMIEENLYWVIVAERWRDTKAAVENCPDMIGQPREFVKAAVDKGARRHGRSRRGRSSRECRWSRSSTVGRRLTPLQIR